MNDTNKDWVLVPREPTDEMFEAGRTAVMARDCSSAKWSPAQHYAASGESTEGIPAEKLAGYHSKIPKEQGAALVWFAMLAAAPTPPTEAQGMGGGEHVETLRAMGSVFSRIPSPCAERGALDAAIAALSAQPRPDATFAEWLATEMPAGTIIGDPAWWANRIARQYAVRSSQPASAPAVGRDWHEDASHENGDYECACVTCGNRFVGHKRRVVCRACAKPASAPVGVDEIEALKRVRNTLCDWAYDEQSAVIARLEAALAQQPAAAMSREAVIEVARACAYAKHDDHSYLPQTIAEAREWMPHEWVIEAIRWQQPAAVDEAWLSKARELYDRCKLWPENSGDGFMALLDLRNHVAAALAQPQGEG